MAKDLGWNAADIFSGNLPVSFPPDPANSGVLVDNDIGNPYFIAGVVNYVSGTVVWTTNWTPSGSDGPPAITFPDGTDAGTIVITPTAFAFERGVLEITATLDGVPCTNGPLTFATTDGGTYGTFAWDHGDTAPEVIVEPLVELVAPFLCFLVEGHSITPDSKYDDITPMQGHDRKRKVQTYAPQIVNVSAILEEDEARAVDEWFENVLNVGVEKWAARIAELGPNSKYWNSEWVAPPQWIPMALRRFKLVGQLLTTGDGHSDPPVTVTLALDFGVTLTGSAHVSAPVELAIEFTLGLRAHNPFRIAFSLPLTRPTYELREDGGFELREDGGKELRG